jgi:uncharacterized protein
MKIQLGGLSEGIHNYTFTANAKEVGVAETFLARPVTVEASLEKTGHELLLHASIQAPARLTCDRCLTEFVQTLSSSYNMYYVEEGSERGNLQPEEIQFLPPDNTIIDITDDVRQTVLLSIPLKILCSESCLGLCPSCGRNLNTGRCSCTREEVDPRWEKLRTLQMKRIGKQAAE